MTPDLQAVIGRMEADLTSIREERAELLNREEKLRVREAELEVTLRNLNEYTSRSGEESASIEITLSDEERPATLDSQSQAAEAETQSWGGVSIREAAIGVLYRTPGKMVSAQHIAETLLSEGYNYTRGVIRLRETISAVLGQHIDRHATPRIERPQPARFVVGSTSGVALTPAV